MNLATNFKAFTFYIANGKINWKKLTFKKATQLPPLENNETSQGEGDGAAEDKNATLGKKGRETMIKGFAKKFYAYLKNNRDQIIQLVARAFCSAADKALQSSASASPPNGTQTWMDKYPAAKPMVKSAVAICNMITALLHGETAKICIGSESECGSSPVNYTNATNRTASFVIEQRGSYDRTDTGRRLEANYTIVEPSVVSIGIIARAITGDSFFGNATNVSSSSPTLDAIKFANVSMGVLIDANKTTNRTRFKLDMAAEPMLQNVAFFDVVRPYMGTLKHANVGVEVLTQKKSNGTGRMKWGFGFNVGARFTAPDGPVDAGTPVVQLMGRGGNSLSCDREKGILFRIEKKADLDSTFALKNFHVDVDACIRFHISKLPFQQNSSTCDSSHVDLFGDYIPKSEGSTYKGFRAYSDLKCIPLAGKSWNGDVGLVALWGDGTSNISNRNYSIGFSGNVSSDSNLGATLFFAFKRENMKKKYAFGFQFSNPSSDNSRGVVADNATTDENVTMGDMMTGVLGENVDMKDKGSMRFVDAAIGLCVGAGANDFDGALDASTKIMRDIFTGDHDHGTKCGEGKPYGFASANVDILKSDGKTPAISLDFDASIAFERRLGEDPNASSTLNITAHAGAGSSDTNNASFYYGIRVDNASLDAGWQLSKDAGKKWKIQTWRACLKGKISVEDILDDLAAELCVAKGYFYVKVEKGLQLFKHEFPSLDMLVLRGSDSTKAYEDFQADHTPGGPFEKEVDLDVVNTFQNELDWGDSTPANISSSDVPFSPPRFSLVVGDVEVEAIRSTLNISFSGTRIAYYSSEKTLIIYDTNVTFRLQKIGMEFTGRLYLLKLNASDGFLNGLKSMTCFGEFNAMFGNSTRMFPMVQFGMTPASGKNTSTYALRLSKFDEFAKGLFGYIRDKTGANIPNFGEDFVVNLATNFKAFTFYIANGKINWKKLTFKKATQLPPLENNETSQGEGDGAAEDKNATLGKKGRETMIKGFAKKFYAYLKNNRDQIIQLVARAFCSAADKALQSSASASPPNGTQTWMDKYPAAKPMVKSAVAICNMITALLHGETAKICIGSESECGSSPVNYTNATNRTASFVIEQRGSYDRTDTGRRLEANYTIVEPSVVSIGIIARAITGDSFFGNATNVSSSSPTLDAIKFANVSMGVLIDANKTTNRTRFKLDMAAEPMLQNVAFFDVVRPYMGTLKHANVGVEVLTQKKSNGTGRMKWGFGFNVGARFTAPDGPVDAGTPVVQLMGRGGNSLSCDREKGILFRIEKKADLDSTFALKNFHVDVDACIRFHISKLPFQQNSSTCDSSHVDLFGDYIPKSEGSTYKGFRAYSDLNCIPLAGKSWNGDVGLVALWGDRASNISNRNYSIGFSGNVSSDSNLGATLFLHLSEKT